MNGIIDFSGGRPAVAMNMLTAPAEVIKATVLPLLGWNDLMRLRLVCKGLHRLVRDYVKEHPEVAPEIEISGEVGKTFANFLKIGVTTSKVFINNGKSGAGFYEEDEQSMDRFLKEYGPLVKHLRVKVLALHLCGGEWTFLNGLTNLEGLEAHRFGIGVELEEVAKKDLVQLEEASIYKAFKDRRYLETNPPVPRVFRQLKVLKIEQDDGLLIPRVKDRFKELVEIGAKLEHVGIPLGHFWGSGTREDNRKSLKMAFEYLQSYLDGLEAPYRTLKTVEFRYCYLNISDKEAREMEVVAGDTFAKMVVVAVKKNVRFLTPHASWFRGCGRYPTKAGKIVESMVNIHPWIFRFDMANLTKVEIRSTKQCSAGPGLSWKQNRLVWPYLQVLDITVDSDKSETRDLFKFLFRDVRRSALTQVRLNFVKDKDSVSVPKTEDIVGSCRNLKSLTVINWPGSNKSLRTLWSGLRDLEELTLDNCRHLGLGAFIDCSSLPKSKKVQKQPIFKLKQLRKLSLKEVDQMPNVNDRLFSTVIACLALEHFEITAEKPIENVTVQGVSALLNGQFAESIKKFPFRGWSLKQVPPSKFRDLERKFMSTIQQIS